MKPTIAIAPLAVVALLVLSSATAAPPKGAVRGTFTVGILAQSDPLAKYMRWSNAFCVWAKDHVMVHVSAKNTGAEHVTATIEPRYFIARGGEHGSGLTSGKNYGFDGGEFRSLWIDAGKPKGVTPKSRIARCAPYLFAIKSG